MTVCVHGKPFRNTANLKLKVCDSAIRNRFPIRCEKRIVIAIVQKQRVEIDKIDGLVLDVVAKYLKIVAVIECVHGSRQRTRQM